MTTLLRQMGKLRLAQLAWGTDGETRLQTGIGMASLAFRGSVEGGFCHYPFNGRGNRSSDGPPSLAVRKGQEGAQTQVCRTPRCDLSHQITPSEPRLSPDTQQKPPPSPTPRTTGSARKLQNTQRMKIRISQTDLVGGQGRKTGSTPWRGWGAHG